MLSKAQQAIIARRLGLATPADKRQAIQMAQLIIKGAIK